MRWLRSFKSVSARLRDDLEIKNTCALAEDTSSFLFHSTLVRMAKINQTMSGGSQLEF